MNAITLIDLTITQDYQNTGVKAVFANLRNGEKNNGEKTIKLWEWLVEDSSGKSHYGKLMRKYGNISANQRDELYNFLKGSELEQNDHNYCVPEKIYDLIDDRVRGINW